MFWIVLFICYELVQLFCLPFVIPYTLVKNLNATQPTHIVAEQLGFIPASDRTKKVIWIHGLSAGEISSLQELTHEIRKNMPNTLCYITAGTQEGIKVAQQQLNPDYVSLLPHDDALSMAIAFDKINPQAIILLEHEVHPTLIMLAKHKSIPVYLLNAQYTSNTRKNLETYGFFYRDLFNSFNTVFVQSDNDKIAFEKTGVISDKIRAIGNIKAYNVLPKKIALMPDIRDFIQNYHIQPEHSPTKPTRPTILLVGSVHKDEVDYYLNVFKTLKPTHPDLKLILAPRFFDWKELLGQKLKNSGYTSTIFDNAQACPTEPKKLLEFITQELLPKNDIIAICLLGKLFVMYPLADIFFLGGTFLTHIGGHNLLEPAAWSNPTILGPCYQNTKDIADELKLHNAVIQVQNEQELIAQAKFLLDNKQERIDMGNRAGAWLETEATRVKTNVQLLIDDLKQINT